MSVLSQSGLPWYFPFAARKVWAFTGGPHGAWEREAAWAALDFAPSTTESGCVTSTEWVVAASPGLVTRSENGLVVLDLDGDGREETGCVMIYLHLAADGRKPAGVLVEQGARLGHPSCEGGIATGAHVHIARKYNGEWIPADQELPFILDGWVSRGAGGLYDGYMERDGKLVEAYEGRSPDNMIQR